MNYPRGDLLAEGRAPFSLTQLLDERPYYEGIVEYLADDDRPLDREQEAQLMGLFQQCHRIAYGEPWKEAETSEASLAYAMAARLPFELSEKQALLETRSEAKRREKLLRLVTELIPRLEHRGRARRSAGGNGHGLN